MYLVDETPIEADWVNPAEQQPAELAMKELDRIYAFVYSRVGNREDTEDLTQEVAVKALPRIREGRHQAEIRSYLYATARSVLAEFWSAQLGRPQAPLRDDYWQDKQLSPEPAAAANEVERLLGLIPPHYRRLLELRFLRGYSSREVAAELGTTVGAVKVMQLRALRAVAAAGHRIETRA